MAVELANPTDAERMAIALCGRRGLSCERASEYFDPPVSPATAKRAWSSARRRLCSAWDGVKWVETLAKTK